MKNKEVKKPPIKHEERILKDIASEQRRLQHYRDITVKDTHSDYIDKISYAYFLIPSAGEINIIANSLDVHRNPVTIRMQLSTVSVCIYAKKINFTSMPFDKWETSEIKELLEVLPIEACITFEIISEYGLSEWFSWDYEHDEPIC